MSKGKIMFDEFAWVILIAVAFILITTIVLTIGIASPIIEPKSLSFTLAKGDLQQFTITLRSSDDGNLKNVTLSSFGEIRDWITLEKTNLDINNSTSLRVKINVPSTAILKTYTGGIKAESKGGSYTLSLSVVVSKVSQLKLDSRPIFLGDVQVVYSKGSETLESKGGLSVSKGGFSETKQSFSVAIPLEKMPLITSSFLELTVVEASKKGSLIVEFNGKEIYNKVTDLGKVIIPIEKSRLNSTNIVSIRTTGPSFLVFWSKASYKIETANFVIKFQDTAERERAFTLNPAEITNFHHFQLQARVKEYSALEELFVKINNQLVYAAKPPLVVMNETISKDLLGNKLLLGENNKISFSFEKESYINLNDVFIVVYFS